MFRRVNLIPSKLVIGFPFSSASLNSASCLASSFGVSASEGVDGVVSVDSLEAGGVVGVPSVPDVSGVVVTSGLLVSSVVPAVSSAYAIVEVKAGLAAKMVPKEADTTFLYTFRDILKNLSFQFL